MFGITSDESKICSLFWAACAKIQERGGGFRIRYGRGAEYGIADRFADMRIEHRETDRVLFVEVYRSADYAVQKSQIFDTHNFQGRLRTLYGEIETKVLVIVANDEIFNGKSRKAENARMMLSNFVVTPEDPSEFHILNLAREIEKFFLAPTSQKAITGLNS